MAAILFWNVQTFIFKKPIHFHATVICYFKTVLQNYCIFGVEGTLFEPKMMGLDYSVLNTQLQP
jgi:hypothetical protein